MSTFDISQLLKQIENGELKLVELPDELPTYQPQPSETKQLTRALETANISTYSLPGSRDKRYLNIVSPYLSLFLNAALKSKTLHYLNLSRHNFNLINPLVRDVLCPLIKKHVELKVLDVSDTGLWRQDNAARKALVETLNNSNISYINLAGWGLEKNIGHTADISSKVKNAYLQYQQLTLVPLRALTTIKEQMTDLTQANINDTTLPNTLKTTQQALQKLTQLIPDKTIYQDSLTITENLILDYIELLLVEATTTTQQEQLHKAYMLALSLLGNIDDKNTIFTRAKPLFEQITQEIQLLIEIPNSLLAQYSIQLPSTHAFYKPLMQALGHYCLSRNTNPETKAHVSKALAFWLQPNLDIDPTVCSLVAELMSIKGLPHIETLSKLEKTNQLLFHTAIAGVHFWQTKLSLPEYSTESTENDTAKTTSQHSLTTNSMA